MTSQRTIPAPWLHDDTEEDLVGADWHQNAIRELSFGLKDLARRLDVPWHVGDQQTLVAPQPAMHGRSRRLWRPMPDITLHPHAGPAERAEMVVEIDGVPLLVIEVASPTTWEYDVDLREGGKAWGYLQLGVPNYLVFDPHRDLLDESCRGWQVSGGELQPWRPRLDGRYQVAGLDVFLRPEENLLRILDGRGQPVPFGYETTQLDQEKSRRIAELEAELAKLRGQRP